MKEYRLYIETGNAKAVADVVAAFTNATVLSGYGIWRGKVEACTVVIIIEDEVNELMLQVLALALCDEFNQHTILATETETEAKLL